MHLTGGHRTAAIYVRISEDKDGQGAGVERQEADCRRIVAEHGWTVGQVYAENDTSAFRRKVVTLPDGRQARRVVRPQFRAMMDDLASGAVDALVVYNLDRMVRDPRDLEDLIDLVEERGIPTYAASGMLDLSNDHGITTARLQCAFANQESRNTSRRVARKHLSLAQQGRPSGGGIRAYGYERDGMTVVEAEAEVVREMARRVIAGESLAAIAQDLTNRGVPTVRGGAWQGRSVHSVVTKARNAGLREHRGEVLGKAQWPAIITEDEWAQMRVALAGRGEGGTNTLRRWLSGVLVCSHCGRGLVGGTHPNGSPRYWCKPVPQGRGDEVHGCGRIAIDAARAEAEVESRILAYLSRQDVARRLMDSSSGAAIDRARADLAADEAQLRELAELWGAKAITTAEYLAARAPIERRIQDAEGRVGAMLPGTVRRLLTAPDLVAAWSDYEPSRRREIARVVFPNGILVQPATQRGRFDPDRLAVA